MNATDRTSTLIRGGRIIDPASGLDATGDVLISDGRIKAIEVGQPLSVEPDTRVHDASGCLVVPGLIDIHVHLRDPGQQHKETIRTGSMAAVAGGFTTICCMPNTAPALDAPEHVEYVHARAGEAGLARVHCIGAATLGRKGLTLSPIESLARNGCVGFSDDGDCIENPDMMKSVLQACAATNSVFMQHCQEKSLTIGSVMHEGAVSLKLGLRGWPRQAEEMIIDRDVRINRDIGCSYHAQHLSSAGSIKIIRDARSRGEPVTGEVTPHHLLLTDEACLDYDTDAKMNPPLRTEADRLKLIESVADGTITILATDHAPHTMAEKQQPFDDAPFGIIGVETALPLYARALVESSAIDWPRLIACMTINPARLLRLDENGLGRLEPGGPADVTIIDPDHQWIIAPEMFHCRSRNCPFNGWTVNARAIATFVGGRPCHVLEDSRFQSPA